VPFQGALLGDLQLAADLESTRPFGVDFSTPKTDRVSFPCDHCPYDIRQDQRIALGADRVEIWPGNRMCLAATIKHDKLARLLCQDAGEQRGRASRASARDAPGDYREQQDEPFHDTTLTLPKQSVEQRPDLLARRAVVADARRVAGGRQ